MHVHISFIWICLLLLQSLHLLSFVPVEHVDQSLAPEVGQIIRWVNHETKSVFRTLDGQFFVFTQDKSSRSIHWDPSRVSVVLRFLDSNLCRCWDDQGSKTQWMRSKGRNANALSVRHHYRTSGWHVVGCWTSRSGDNNAISDQSSHVVSIKHQLYLDGVRRWTSIDYNFVDDVKVLNSKGLWFYEFISSENLSVRVCHIKLQSQSVVKMEFAWSAKG